MATISAASLLSSSTQCAREWNSVKTSSFVPRWASNNCLKLVVLKQSRKKYPSWARASQVTGSAAITADKINQEIGCLGVKAEEGEGKLPKVILKSDGGSEVEIYLFGGCISSWKIPEGKDLLFVRPDAVFNGQKPISGGIPHCFPQFGPGPMQQHGFARNMMWSVASSSNSEGNPMASVTGALVKGLKGCKTLSKFPDPKNPIEGVEERCD